METRHVQKVDNSLLHVKEDVVWMNKRIWQYYLKQYSTNEVGMIEMC